MLRALATFDDFRDRSPSTGGGPVLAKHLTKTHDPPLKLKKWNPPWDTQKSDAPPPAYAAIMI